ncbi:MAG: hypothetical protein LBT59_21610 [Clostridiales bacterium]|jgi:hypothetical protein|nr:hypothetical protein [Clostridiales bacterium]
MAKKSKAKQSQQIQEKKQKDRLEKASQWVAAYAGADIVRDYCKEFDVDLIRAVKDLKAVGYTVPQAELDKLLMDENKANGIVPPKPIVVPVKREEPIKSAKSDEPAELIDIESFIAAGRLYAETHSANMSELDLHLQWYDEALKRIKSARDLMPKIEVPFQDIDEDLKMDTTDDIYDLLSLYIGDIDWPPTPEAKDLILTSVCSDLLDSLGWADPEDSDDIDWRKWVEAFDAGETDSSYIITQATVIIPDEEMEDYFDEAVERFNTKYSQDELAKTSDKTIEELIREADPANDEKLSKRFVDIVNAIKAMSASQNQFYGL